jgi:hypothetical protein
MLAASVLLLNEEQVDFRSIKTKITRVVRKSQISSKNEVFPQPAMYRVHPRSIVPWEAHESRLNIRAILGIARRSTVRDRAVSAAAASSMNSPAKQPTKAPVY